MEMQIRQQTLEKELSLMKDTIWRLQGRIYTLETFLKEKFGEIVVDFGLRLLNAENPHAFVNASEHVSEIFQQNHTVGTRIPLEEIDLGNRAQQSAVIHTTTLRADSGDQWKQSIVNKTDVRNGDRIPQEVYYQESILRTAASEPNTVNIGDEFVVIPQDTKFCMNDLGVGANEIAEVEPTASTSADMKPISARKRKKANNTVTEYKCVPCNRSFTFEWRYKAHLLQHSGQGKAPKPVNRAYVCEYCNKKFINKNVLQVHTRIHTGEKPYKCSVCAKAFSQSSSCKTHERIHTGEKPYTCKICSTSFSHSQNLHKHMQSAHNNESNE